MSVVDVTVSPFIRTVEVVSEGVTVAVGGFGPAGAEGPMGPEGPPGAPGGLTYAGAWDSGTTYQVDEVVEYQGSAWVGTALSTGETPGPLSAFWALLVSKGDQGADGDVGPEGDPGPAGPTGPAGAAATVAVGSTTTGAPGTNASVANVGTSSAAILAFAIPRGATGEQGIQGVQGEQGIQGLQGDPGPAGDDGAPGTAATIAVGTTTTGAPGTDAEVTNVGTASAAIFNFVVPQGEPGEGGGGSGTVAVHGGLEDTGTPGASDIGIATGGVTSAMIANGTITDTDVAAANKDGTAGTASLRTLGTGATQAAAGNDSRLSDSRAPNGAAGGVLSGTYPNPGLADGAVSTAAKLADGVVTSVKILDGTITDTDVAAANKDGLAATASLRTLGTGATQAAAGNDSRLSDSRAPNGAAGGVLGGTYPNPSLADGAVSTTAKLADSVVTSAKIVDGTITDTDVAAANKDGTAGIASMRTLGTGATQAAAGNDTRLSDSRAPNGAAGGVLSGTYPNPGLADGAVSTTAKLANSVVTDAKVAAANKDGAAGTASMRTLGTGATQAAAGNDSRLSDARAPTGTAGGDLGGTYPNPTVDNVSEILVNYDSIAANIMNGFAYPTDAGASAGDWVNIGSGTSLLQTFTAVAGAIYEVCAGGFGMYLTDTSTQIAARLLLDDTTALPFGGSVIPTVVGAGSNLFSGTMPVFLTGLSAGSHTLQPQLQASQPGLVYIRGGGEAMKITVVEHRKMAP